MTTTLKTLRLELVDAIKQDLTIYDHVPGRAALPAAFITAGSPYISSGLTLGTQQVRFVVTILTAPSLNSVETDELDAWIEGVQHDLDADDWVVERVDRPGFEDLNGTEVLATEIHVATDATFTRKV